ncbi:MAG: hypothetical protein AUJ92_14725 [Armatimonadetes bacterium CG2_30_59_28]|nr:MAG: hypothetical protein AUJ92_14725 [Armatimonadetes bacterium CG2_30_59_28]PIX39911.1 MAG: hypothetical protein COZ56_16220 [Armatimonadetes bacterium CG_4_8_14_3_um_filter_58_9]
MFRIVKKPFFATSARITLLTFIASVLAQPAFVTTASSDGSKGEQRSVAVVDFHNVSTHADPVIAEVAGNSTILSLLEIPGLSVVSGEKVKNAAAKVDLSDPVFGLQLSQVGSAVGTDWVLGGKITRAEANAAKRTVSVDLELNVYESATGNLALKSRALGAAKGVENDTSAWNEAARNAGRQAVQHLSESLHMKGIVITKPKSGHVRINIGTQQMIRPGAEVLFINQGQQTASGMVVNADLVESLVEVTPPEAANAVIVGDTVRVTYNPSKTFALDDTEPDKAKKSRNKSTTNLVVGILLVVAAAALIGGGGGGGKSVPPGTAIGPPANLALRFTDTNIPGWDVIGVRTTVRANVTDANGRPVADGTPVTFTTEETKGQILDPVVETVQGAATATFESNAPKGNGLPEGVPASGICAITASVKGVGGATITKTTNIVLSGDPRIVSVTPSPATTSAGGSSLITAIVTDVNGNPVDSEKTISFNTGKGSMSPTTRTTDDKSTVFTSTLKNDDADPPTAGTAVVTVQMDGTDAVSTTVTFT